VATFMNCNASRTSKRSLGVAVSVPVRLTILILASVGDNLWTATQSLAKDHVICDEIRHPFLLRYHQGYLREVGEEMKVAGYHWNDWTGIVRDMRALRQTVAGASRNVAAFKAATFLAL